MFPGDGLSDHQVDFNALSSLPFMPSFANVLIRAENNPWASPLQKAAGWAPIFRAITPL